MRWLPAEASPLTRRNSPSRPNAFYHRIIPSRILYQCRGMSKSISLFYRHFVVIRISTVPRSESSWGCCGGTLAFEARLRQNVYKCSCRGSQGGVRCLPNYRPIPCWDLMPCVWKRKWMSPRSRCQKPYWWVYRKRQFAKARTGWPGRWSIPALLYRGSVW